MIDVLKWSQTADPGDRVVYHSRDQHGSPIMESNSVMFSRALEAHDCGLVFLAQQRVRKGPRAGGLEYTATKITLACAQALKLVHPGSSYRRVA